MCVKCLFKLRLAKGSASGVEHEADKLMKSLRAKEKAVQDVLSQLSCGF